MRPIRPSNVVMTSCVIGRAPAKAGAQDHTRRARNSGFLLSQEHERASLSLPRQLAADDHAHHLVGAFEDRMDAQITRSEEHTSELQSLMRISYALFCLNKKNKTNST